MDAYLNACCWSIDSLGHQLEAKITLEIKRIKLLAIFIIISSEMGCIIFCMYTFTEEDQIILKEMMKYYFGRFSIVPYYGLYITIFVTSYGLSSIILCLLSFSYHISVQYKMLRQFLIDMKRACLNKLSPLSQDDILRNLKFCVKHHQRLKK